MSITFTFDFGKILWEAHAWTLHLDNAPAHTVLSIRNFFAEKRHCNFDTPPILPQSGPV